MMTIVDRHGIPCDVSPIHRDIGLINKAPMSKFGHKGEVLDIVRLHLFDDYVDPLTMLSFHLSTIFFLFCILCHVLDHLIANIGLLSNCGL
jgi:hypothetical protein